MKLLLLLVLTTALISTVRAQVPTCDCACGGYGQDVNNVKSDASTCSDANPCDVCNSYCTGTTWHFVCHDNGSTASAWFYALAAAVVAVIFTAWIYRRRKALGLDVTNGRMAMHCLGCFCCSALYCCIYFCIESNETSQRMQFNGGQQAVYAQPVYVQPMQGGMPGQQQVVMAVPVGQGYSGQPQYGQPQPYGQPGTYAQMPPPQYGTAYPQQQGAYAGTPYTMQPEGQAVQPQVVVVQQQPPGTM